MNIRIGTSGWSYDHWTGVLYPPKTPPAKRLALYVQEFDTVELNASFYRWPRDSTFTGWRERLPDGFTMSVKAHRGLTHFRRLRSPEPWVERFGRCWRALGDRAGMLLVQLHPEQQRDDARLDYFLGCMPGWIRVAMELRHPSWDDPQVYELLERHRAAYVVMSGAGLPCVLRATTDVVYVRMHGPDSENLYAGSYSDDDLRWWADRIIEWADQGRDVFVYFNNDGFGYAVLNARELRRLVLQR
ncbi:MAG: sensor histidine kinase [Mycobacterium sp.]|nr:sensor histidine kinase [Mycobacterium sp.]